jgi:hypothetical protein
MPRALVVTAAAALLACEEQMPTSVAVAPLPAEPVTVEILLPWTEFGSNLEVFGGYGRPDDVDEAIVAKSFAGTLDARMLVRFGGYPVAASVRDSTGTLRTDANISYFGGYIVLDLDTRASTTTGPVTFALGATQTVWHPASATWTSAIDTVGDRRSWPEAGAGPVTPLGTRDWRLADGDSIQLFVDSATVAAWGVATDSTRGARIELLTDGPRLHVESIRLRLYARSSINPDTALVLTAQTFAATFVYTPEAPPPSEGMRVGGVPAWRTIFDVDVPVRLTGPPELCAAVGCPFTLGPQHVNHAALLLRSKRTEDAFQPTDTVAIDARPVLSRRAMPKSPLGLSLLSSPFGQPVPPGPFGALEGSLVEIPVTPFVKAYLAGPDPSGRPPPRTLALLAANEPEGFAFASFFGPGPDGPVLKLVLTVSPPMELP